MSLHFDQFFDTAMLISRLVVVFIGIVGNILSFMIFSRKTFRKNSISTYCRALAIFDNLLIIQFIIDVYEAIYNDHLHNVSDGACKIMYYLSIQYGAIPGWILAAFSIDKMFSIRTHQIRLLKNKRFQWSVVAVIAILNLIFYVEILISFRLVPSRFSINSLFCDITALEYFSAFIFAMLIESCFIPFLIMLISSIVTIRLLNKSRETVELSGILNKLRRSRDKKFAISSLILNVVYVLVKSPFFVFYIFYAKDPFGSSYYFFHFSFLILLVNCSATFFVHLLTNSIFRRELFIIVKSGFSYKNNHSSSSIQNHY